MEISYHCRECGKLAITGVDDQGEEGALHCPDHPNALIESIAMLSASSVERAARRTSALVSLLGARLGLATTAPAWAAYVRLEDEVRALRAAVARLEVAQASEIATAGR